MLQGARLLEKVKSILADDIASIAISCDYEQGDGTADLSRFFDQLLISLGFPQTLSEASESAIDWLHEMGGGCSPITQNDQISGRSEIRISAAARDHDWDDKDWDELRAELGEDHMDGPYEVLCSSSAGLESEGFDRLEDAVSEFNGRFIDLFRLAYRMLGDDENGHSLNEFLSQYEQHPRDYFELIEHLNPGCNPQPSGLSSDETPQDLEPCPFCGNHQTLCLTSAAEEWEEDEANDGHPFPHVNTYAVICPLNPRSKMGCGATGGYGITTEKAKQNWNQRA